MCIFEAKSWFDWVTSSIEHEEYIRTVRDDPKFLSYGMMVERYPNHKEEAGGAIPGCEISSLPNGKLARWSIASYPML